MDGITRTNTLSQCRVTDYNKCAQTRENVTCEGVLFTHTRRLQQIATSCKRSDYNNFLRSCESSTLSILMSERAKQVSFFFDAAHFMCSEVIDIL